MNNYAAKLANDSSGEPMQNAPAPIPAKATWAAIVALGVSSVISLGDRTTVVEVEASGGNGVAIRWVKTSETAGVSPFASVISSGLGLANYDHIVPSGVVRRFVVPIDDSIRVNVQSVMGTNGQNGLYKRLAWTAAGATASVMATEF